MSIQSVCRSEYVTINDIRIHYIQAGTNDPPVLLLHGIPANAYLWRNIIPRISSYARTIAVDLIGFGKSDKPTDVEYNLQTYTKYLKSTIEALDLERIILVGMDLGLLVGLNYAMQNEANISGLVLFEGFFQPMDMAYKNLPLINKLSFQILKNKKMAERMIVRDGINMVEKMLAMSTIKKLTKEEIAEYQTPFSDEVVRRKVWFEGVGPTNIKSKSAYPGDLIDLINQNAIKLSLSSIPKLLLYAKPGMVVSEQTAKLAKGNIANLEVKFIGNGKHFLPEDQPENMSQAIIEFYKARQR